MQRIFVTPLVDGTYTFGPLRADLQDWHNNCLSFEFYDDAACTIVSETAITSGLVSVHGRPTPHSAISALETDSVDMDFSLNTSQLRWSGPTEYITLTIAGFVGPAYMKLIHKTYNGQA